MITSISPASVLPWRQAPGAPNKAALDACLTDLSQPASGVLALVLDVTGHTYAKPGIMVHFTAAGRRCGWISPGCLEGAVSDAADATRADGRVRLLDLDNRDLSDVFSGAGAGCRGRQRVVMLPLAALPGLHRILASYREHRDALRLHYAVHGRLWIQAGAQQAEWILPVDTTLPAAEIDGAVWALQWAPLPSVLVCGAGPESEILLPLLHQLGWRVDLLEPRPDWTAGTTQVERLLPVAPSEGGSYDAVLVMAHHFGHDRDTLEILAGWPQLPGYVGLVGPESRRDDLLATLPADVRQRLGGRLESPVGLPLGCGAAAIALSLAARLQTQMQWIHEEHRLRCRPVPVSDPIDTHEARYAD